MSRAVTILLMFWLKSGLVYADTVKINVDTVIQRQFIKVATYKSGNRIREMISVPYVMIYNRRGSLAFEGTAFDALNLDLPKLLLHRSIPASSNTLDKARGQLGFKPAKLDFAYAHFFFQSAQNCPPCSGLFERFTDKVRREFGDRFIIDSIEMVE